MTCSESALQVVELGPEQVCLPQRKLPAVWGEVSWLWLSELRQATRGPPSCRFLVRRRSTNVLGCDGAGNPGSGWALGAWFIFVELGVLTRPVGLIIPARRGHYLDDPPYNRAGHPQCSPSERITMTTYGGLLHARNCPECFTRASFVPARRGRRMTISAASLPGVDSC